jgi:hypothetical protein
LVIDRAVNEYRGNFSQFSSWLQADLPKALAALDRMSEALQSYVATAAPVESAPPPPDEESG